MDGKDPMAKAQIVYFSKSGENYSAEGKMVHAEEGDVKRIALALHGLLASDVSEIQPIKAYPDKLKSFVWVELCHQLFHCHPKVEATPALNDASLIYLCYPIYMGTLPSYVASFLRQRNWDGKTIVPIASSIATGFGKSLKALKKLCPKATIAPGLSILAKDRNALETRLKAFLEKKNPV